MSHRTIACFMAPKWVSSSSRLPPSVAGIRCVRARWGCDNTLSDTRRRAAYQSPLAAGIICLPRHRYWLCDEPLCTQAHTPDTLSKPSAVPHGIRRYGYGTSLRLSYYLLNADMDSHRLSSSLAPYLHERSGEVCAIFSQATSIGSGCSLASAISFCFAFPLTHPR